MNYPPKIQEIIQDPCELLTAAKIAPLVGKDPNTLRFLARYYPEKLPFAVVADKDNSSVRFIKSSVLRALGYTINA